MSNKNIKNVDLVTMFPKATHKEVILLEKENSKTGKSVTFYLAQYTDSPISYSGLANNATSNSNNTSYKGKKGIVIETTAQQVNSPKKLDSVIRAIIPVNLVGLDDFTSKLANNTEELVEIHGFCDAEVNRRPYYVKEGKLIISQQKLHKNPTSGQILCAIDADGRWLITKNVLLVPKKNGYKNTQVNDENYDMLGLTWIEESELEAQIKFEHEYHVKMSLTETPSIGFVSITEEQVAMNPFKS
jgi:hypothetical protein